MKNNESIDNISLDRVITALAHPEWRVRARAVQMLLPFGDKVPSQHLKKALLDEHKAVRIAALEVCAVLPQHIPVALVEAALADHNWSVRAAAAYALGSYGRKAPLARLMAIVDDVEESSLVRSSALQALGMVQGRDLRQRIMQALHDSTWHVREMAALLLGWLGERRAIPALLEVFQNDSDPFVRSATIIALGQMKDGDETIHRVLRAATQDAEVYVRDAARQALEEDA